MMHPCSRLFEKKDPTCYIVGQLSARSSFHTIAIPQPLFKHQPRYPLQFNQLQSIPHPTHPSLCLDTETTTISQAAKEVVMETLNNQEISSAEALEEVTTRPPVEEVMVEVMTTRCPQVGVLEEETIIKAPAAAAMEEDTVEAMTTRCPQVEVMEGETIIKAPVAAAMEEEVAIKAQEVALAEETTISPPAAAATEEETLECPGALVGSRGSLSKLARATFRRSSRALVFSVWVDISLMKFH